jgi:ankyrin repeat protein
MGAIFDEVSINAPTFSYSQLGGSLLGSAYNNDWETVRELVGHHHAPINFVDNQTGLTALHIAVGRDHLDIAKYLVEQGASFLPDKQGRTPTTVAAECEVSDEMCDFIAEAEAKAEGV